MLRLFSPSILVFLWAPAVHAEFTIGSSAFGKHYVVTITEEDMEKSPIWKDRDDNPPLSARRAIRLAEKLKNLLVKDSDGYRWEFREATLQCAGGGRWYWLMYYEAIHKGFNMGLAPNLRLVVLMDGRVVRPEVTEDK